MRKTLALTKPLTKAPISSSGGINFNPLQQRGWPSAVERGAAGNDDDDAWEQYEGFCIDLLKEMAKFLNFTYELVEVDDGAYGVEVSECIRDGERGMKKNRRTCECVNIRMRMVDGMASLDRCNGTRRI